MELIVAEKPKVAYTIARALGESISTKQHGRVRYFELERDGRQIVVAPAVGHIYALAEKKGGRGYPTFDIGWKPAYQVNRGAFFTKPYLDVLQGLGEKADKVTVACDYDIEGSLIGYNIYRFCYGKEEGGRMKFSSLMPFELREAYDGMLPTIDFNNAKAGETRHMIDWYYGINLSRALMSSLRKAGGRRTMSIGRVQGPTLSILAEREVEIKDFIPQDYWEIRIVLRGTEFLHENGRFFDEREAKRAFEKLESTAGISAVGKERVKKWPWPPFDLTSLQIEAYKAFGFSPSQTLALAQSLYESSLISYPRTSSQKLPKKLGLRKIIGKLAGHEEYKGDAEKLIGNEWFSPREGRKVDPAHPAIHPTGQKGKMTGNEKKVYDLVVRRFLSVFAPPAEVEETKVGAVCGGEPFRAAGSIIVEKGWIAFYPYYRSREKELTAFSEGEEVDVENPERRKDKTKPPARYSPASIISELEKRSLGTKATRSMILDTLYKREYVEGRQLEVTLLGMNVWEMLRKYSPKILDEGLTRKLEGDMEGVREGKLTQEEVLKDGREILVQILDEFKEREMEIGKELLETLGEMEVEQAVMECPACGKPMRIIRLPKGKQFIGCTGYPECRQAYPLPSYSTVKVLERPCKVCGKPMLKVRRGKMFFEMCVDPKCPSKENWGKRSGRSNVSGPHTAKKEKKVTVKVTRKRTVVKKTVKKKVAKKKKEE